MAASGRLGLRAANITDTTAHYERTAAWAGAIHAATDLHGLVWMSRQWNSKRCVALFEDRAPALRIVDKGARLFGSAPDDAEWLAGLCHSLGVRMMPVR